MSSLCVHVDSNGFVMSSSVPVSSCSAYVLLDSADYAGTSIWQVPPPSELTAVWTFAFVAPLVVYLMAFSLGSVLSFLRS